MLKLFQFFLFSAAIVYGADTVALADDIQPLPGTKATQTNTLKLGDIWVSKWDNPPVGGTLKFLTNQSAKRVDDAWSYSLFDLEIRTNGPINNLNQNETRFLYTWPTSPKVLPTAPDFDWEIHGINLSPRITKQPLEGVTTLQRMRDDSDPNIGQHAEGKSARFQLDPNVILVPIHVIVLAPDDGSFPSDWFTEALADVLLDDTWDGDKLKVTNPMESPHEVLTNWNAKTDCTASYCSSVPAIQPDRIFDQCDIQFRKVSFHLCVVPADTFLNSDPLKGCDPNHQAFKIKQALQTCPGVGPPNGILTDPIPELILTGSLVQNGCFSDVLGGEQSGGSFVFIPNEGLRRKAVVSHEFGHLLSLWHVDTNTTTCPSDNLMCPVDNPTKPFTKLTKGQCDVARKTALGFQKDKWK